MDEQSTVTALAALAQASRLRVYRLLVARGPEGALPGEIAEALDIPATTLSFHLKTLAQSGLVTARPLGRQIRYRADFERMRSVVGFLLDHCCEGAPEQCFPDAPATCAPRC